MDKKQLRNTLMLMACAFIWGTAFVAQSVGSDYMGPYTFLASRSWLACAFLLGLMAVLRKMGKTNPAAEPGFWQNKKVLLRGGIFCGVALFAASAAQQMGIGTTSTAKAGFMTALYVVLVPVAGVFLGSRPGIKLWGCVAASVVGLYLLCLAGRDTLSLTGGEWQLLVCAILFTAQIMLVMGTDEGGLTHPNWQDNLSWALKLQVEMERQYPGLTRPMSLRPERYNQHATPGSVLVEIGTAGDTLQRAILASEAFAHTLVTLIQGLGLR